MYVHNEIYNALFLFNQPRFVLLYSVCDCAFVSSPCDVIAFSPSSPFLIVYPSFVYVYSLTSIFHPA